MKYSREPVGEIVAFIGVVILLALGATSLFWWRRMRILGNKAALSNESLFPEARNVTTPVKLRSWLLPSARRRTVKPTTECRIRELVQSFDVSLETGFLPEIDPLHQLSNPIYLVWEELADDLPKLLGARMGQARGPLQALPVLSTAFIQDTRELRRAHLLLCLFAHAYVFGGHDPVDIVPAGIAVPLVEVSQRLGIPPVLAHHSIVLYNWRRLDAEGDICMENLTTLNNFLSGRDENWFYLITVEVEARGAAAVGPVMLAIDAIQQLHRNNQVSDHRASAGNSTGKIASEEREGYTGTPTPAAVAGFVTQQLHLIADAIADMSVSLLAMREGCHPFIFYHRVRPFLSGWKHNPALPNGVVYEGVSQESQQYFGGSAAQSSLLPMFDIALGVEHDSPKSRTFLQAMRDYMLPPHRAFLQYLEQSKASPPVPLSWGNRPILLRVQRSGKKRGLFQSEWEKVGWRRWQEGRARAERT